MAEAGQGAGLRAYVRGTWLLLGVQLVLALALGGLSFWANQSLGKARVETARLEQQAGKAKGELEAAKKDLETRTKRYAEAAPLIQLGVKAVAAKQPDDARKFFSQAVQINPTDPFTSALLAQTLFDSFDPREAVTAYEAAAKLGPLEPADAVRYAQALCRIGKSNEAIAAAKQASDLDAAKTLYELTQQKAVGRCPALRALVQTTQADASATAQSWAITRIFLQIPSNEDRARANILKTALEAKGFDVPGIELVDDARKYPKTAEVRFYYSEQKANAEALAAQIKEVGASTTPQDSTTTVWYAAPFPIRGLVKRTTGEPLYPGAPADQVEVWLPPTAAEEPAKPVLTKAAVKQP